MMHGCLGNIAAINGNLSEGAGGMKTIREYLMAQGNKEL